MWVWQSQAPAGTSKLTGVAGWAALARTGRARIMTPAAIAPSRTSRRVSMGSSSGGILSVLLRVRLVLGFHVEVPDHLRPANRVFANHAGDGLGMTTPRAHKDSLLNRERNEAAGWGGLVRTSVKHPAI